jgi:hypothetical protein
MRLFLDDFLVIDCRKKDVDDSLVLIRKYYYNRDWFSKEKILERKKILIDEINKSISILSNVITKFLNTK